MGEVERRRVDKSRTKARKATIVSRAASKQSAKRSKRTAGDTWKASNDGTRTIERATYLRLIVRDSTLASKLFDSASRILQTFILTVDRRLVSDKC